MEVKRKSYVNMCFDGMKKNERDLREGRPLNTSDGRDVREFEKRAMEKTEVKGDIENEGKKKKEIRELSLLRPLKDPDSIETSQFTRRLKNRGNEWRRE